MPSTLLLPQPGDIVTRRRRIALPPDVRYIGRPTKYGNPFRVGDIITTPVAGAVRAGAPAPVVELVIDLDLAVLMFDRWARTSDDPAAVWIRANVAELVDRRLACWCPQPGQCHGHVLATMALEATGQDVVVSGHRTTIVRPRLDLDAVVCR